MKIKLLSAAFVCVLSGLAQAQTVPPFRPSPQGPVGDTVSIAVTATAQFVNCDNTLVPASSTQLRAEVIGTQPVTFSLGTTTSPPLPAVVGNFVEMLPNTVEIFTISGNPRLSVVAPAPGSTFRCTSGIGE